MNYSDNIFENEMEPKSHRRFLSPLLHDNECDSECDSESDYNDNDENNSFFDNKSNDEYSNQEEEEEYVDDEEEEEYVDDEEEEVKETLEEEVKETLEEEDKKDTGKIKFHKDCSICQEMLQPTLLKCGHSFHPTCINKWFAINKSCPICRLDTSDTSKDDKWVNVCFDNFDVFHRKLTSGKLYRITYKLVNGVERTVRMKKFMGIKDVAKPSHNSPLLVIKIFEDNFDRKIYYGKITNVQKRS